MTATRKAPTFTPGDRIAYSVNFLKCTGQRTGKAPQMRATVTEVGSPQSASMGAIIQFLTDDVNESGGLACNFTLVSRIGIDSALNT